VVPSEELVEQLDNDNQADEVKSVIRRSLQEIADKQRLNSYEIPRDFMLETDPFSLQNGLLSEIGKFQRPKLRDHYGERLEQMYAQLAQDQIEVLRSLKSGGADRPVLETVSRALQAALGVSLADVGPDVRFGDLGGDSLSALTFSILLKEIFGVEVPVGVIISPIGNVQHLSNYIEAARNFDTKRPSFATVHAADSARVYCGDLKLDKFIDEKLLANASTLTRPGDSIRTVLLTGATGYLGRFQALAWLERLADTGGKLVCIARGADPAQARQRIESALDSDPALITHFRALAAGQLEILPGDIGLPNLGLEADTWAALAGTVDLIVHPAAHVNHVLPYSQLFAANVVGTAELIRLAITTKLKRVNYVSTLGVNVFADRLVEEDSDIRRAIPTCNIDDSYANGYGISKWASEVLLREAFDLCGLPVAVFRPGMILAHSRYAGQLNVPDMFTRLLFSLVVTGIAPATFYAQDARASRPRARYDGLTVDFLANSITAIGARDTHGFHSYNLSSPHDDAISLDNFVDWLIEAGCRIERIDSYDAWLSRFKTAMRALPEEQRQQSMLAILEPYSRPQTPGTKSLLGAEKFRAGLQAAGLDIPHLSSKLIDKYVADLRHLHLL
jgi:fatty acid CoA ligase FadD9